MQFGTSRVPIMLQMEATECGAASLGMIMAHHGLWIPLETLRESCGISRDGSKASNLLRAARTYGFEAKGFRREADALGDMPLPAIIHWNFNHFLVLEKIGKHQVWLADPALGRRVIDRETFSDSFTGVILTFAPSANFKRSGRAPSVGAMMLTKLSHIAPAAALLSLLSLSLVIPGLLIATLTRVFIDDILIGNNHDWLGWVLAGLVLTGLFQVVLSRVRSNHLLRIYLHLSVTSMGRFVWHVLRLPSSFYQARYAGDIVSRIHANDTVAHVVAGELADAMKNALQMFGFLALLFAYDASLTALVLLLVTVQFLGVRMLSGKRREANQVLLQEAGTLAGVSMTGLRNIETIKASGLENDFYAKWSGHYAKEQNARQNGDMLDNLLVAMPQVFAGLTFAALLTLGGYRVMSGEMTAGMLMAYQTLLAFFLGPFEAMMSLWSTIEATAAEMGRIDDVLNQNPAPEAASEPQETLTSVKALTGRLEVRDLTFGFARLETPLLQGISFTIEPGQRIALVGGSGSGKSTIAKLVAGLYTPWSGDILFDGMRRSEIPRAVLTRDVALVDQMIIQFKGSIRDNLSLWDTTTTDQALILAAQDAVIHSDIAERTGGYDAEVDEAGANFSGGQRQRMEIARALVSNPALLILDEATSALDPLSEELIDQNLRKRGCACLIVAHRLSTIRDCDQIIVLEHGRVVETGTHISLMAAGGYYARLMAAE